MPSAGNGTSPRTHYVKSSYTALMRWQGSRYREPLGSKCSMRMAGKTVWIRHLCLTEMHGQGSGVLQADGYRSGHWTKQRKSRVCHRRPRQRQDLPVGWSSAPGSHGIEATAGSGAVYRPRLRWSWLWPSTQHRRSSTGT